MTVDPGAVHAERGAVRELLGTSGRFERADLRSALDAGAGRGALVASAALLVAPWALVTAPHVLGGQVERTTGASVGPAGLGVLFGAAGALPILASLIRRGRGRTPIAVTCSGVAALLLVLLALSSRPPGLLPILGGALFVLSHGAVLSSVVDLFPPHARIRVTSLSLLGGVLGCAVPPLLLALGGGAGLSWRGSVLVIGVLAAVTTVVGSRLPEARPGSFDEGPARAVLRRAAGEPAGDDDGDEPGPFPPARQAMRMALAPASMRSLLVLAATGGLLVGPMQGAVDVLLRDRWVVVSTARPLLLGAVLLAAAASLLLGSRHEVAWRAAPVRSLHLATWAVVLGGVALGVGAVAPTPAVALVPLAVGAAGCAHALLGAVVCTSRVVSADLRALALAMLAAAVAAGAVVGDLVFGSFASRFGAAWGVLALGALLVFVGARAVRALPAVASDAEAAVDRVIEAERLASARRRNVSVPLLECRNVDFSYGQLQVLFDVSFKVDEGEMVALLGTNGAGKSTLLRVISGLGTPSRGAVSLRGSDITFLPTDERVTRGVTQVPGGKAVFGSLSVVDNLRAYGYSLGRDDARLEAGIAQTFETFPRLEERRIQLASTLSGGEQQMLALGKALILEPDLLLIDELSLGLAPKIVGELLEMVQAINRTGTAIVLVEQSVNIALSLVDHAYFMEKGQIRFDGPAKSLLDRPDLLRSVFLAEAGAEDASTESVSTGERSR